MRFGIREVCDLTFKRVSGTGPENFEIKSAKMTTLETASSTVYAQGGKGNARLIAWEGEKTVTFTVEDALISKDTFIALTGATTNAAKTKFTIKTSSFAGTYEIAANTLFRDDFGKKRDKKSGWPAWVQKTDEERVQNCGWLFDGRDTGTWIMTEKIDGTSTTFTMKGKEFFVCSRNVVFDKPDKKCFYETNVYTEMAVKYNMEEVMRDWTKFMKEAGNPLEFLTIQGETYGAGVQKRDYGMKDRDLAIFNVIFGYKDGRVERLNPHRMAKECEFRGLPSVPVLGDIKLPATCEETLALAEAEKSKIDGGMREGIVFRSEDGVNSFKAVSNAFLLKYHG